MLFISKMYDKAVLQIVGMEKDIVDKIVENPDVIEPDLRILKREKQTGCGMIDLFGYDKNKNPVIIEVKRSLATLSSVNQLRMYVNEMNQDNKKIKIRGILCAPRIPTIVKRLLEDYKLEYKEFGWQHELNDDHQKTIDEY